LCCSADVDFGAYVLEAKQDIPKNLILAWQEFSVAIKE
jgi:hypothetical protein